MKWVFIVPALLLMQACVTGPITSKGLYGDQPVKQDIPGSNAQGLTTRVTEFNKQDTFEAAYSALLRLGYNVETKTESTGKLTASGFYNCGGPSAPVTMAIYVEQISRKPESKFTIVIDRHSIACALGFTTVRGADTIAAEIFKVLSTY